MARERDSNHEVISRLQIQSRSIPTLSYPVLRYTVRLSYRSLYSQSRIYLYGSVYTIEIDQLLWYIHISQLGAPFRNRVVWDSPHILHSICRCQYVAFALSLFINTAVVLSFLFFFLLKLIFSDIWIITNKINFIKWNWYLSK